jgi:hypothetical protein
LNLFILIISRLDLNGLRELVKSLANWHLD